MCINSSHTHQGKFTLLTLAARCLRKTGKELWFHGGRLLEYWEIGLPKVVNYLLLGQLGLQAHTHPNQTNLEQKNFKSTFLTKKSCILSNTGL